MKHHDLTALRSVRRLCVVLIVLGLIFVLFYLQSPAKTRALIDAYDFWPTVVICATLVIVAIRAFLKSR